MKKESVSCQFHRIRKQKKLLHSKFKYNKEETCSRHTCGLSQNNVQNIMRSNTRYNLNTFLITKFSMVVNKK